MAVMTLSTASRDAFAASALHLVWIAWISANCSGNGFFDARTSSTGQSGLRPFYPDSATKDHVG